MSSIRRALTLTACIGLAACSKPEPPPERTEPWPAHPPEAAKPSPKIRFDLSRVSRAHVSLRARDATLTGEIRVVEGRLDVDLLHLDRTRGTVRVDVGSILLGSSETTETDREQTSEARNWLDLGSNQPESVRARRRWARFVISEVTEVSADAAHEGKVIRHGQATPPGDSPAQNVGDAGDAAAKPAGEIRRVQLVAVGALTFHGFRVEHTARLRAEFHYPAAATPTTIPTRIVAETRSPLIVPLAAHDIKPRDASGTFVAEGTKLLGTKVGRDVRVSLQLVATPAR
jgi:hypothetical protein